AYDWDELERLSRGLFDDEDVVYVRFTDVVGNTLYDRLLPAYSKWFQHAQPFRAYYRHPMDRDARGMLGDPSALKRKMESSRHRDFIQAFTDGENRLIGYFSSGPPAGAVEEQPRTLYQDRLADERGERDTDLSYALGAITNDEGESYGVVLIAFRHDRLNRATVGKLLKGLAITLFFVSLILVQNFFSRRAKLRLMDLEAALKAARAAISGTLPERPQLDGRDVGVAFSQADRVGGTVYDLRADGGELEILVAVPEGAGVDAAFASVVLRDLYRRVERAANLKEPAEIAEALLAEYDQSPLARPVELLLMRVSPSGAVRGVVAGLAPPSLVEEGAPRAIPAGEPLPIDARHLARPLRQFAADLGERALLFFDDGMPAEAPRRFAPKGALARMAAAAAAQTARGANDAQAIADDAVQQAVKHWHKKHTDDFFALAITRSAARSSSPRAGTSA